MWREKACLGNGWRRNVLIQLAARSEMSPEIRLLVRLLAVLILFLPFGSGRFLLQSTTSSVETSKS
jgi:hypothetical protein